eukprot:s1794_g15.t1
MKRDAETATLVSPRALQRDLVRDPMADVNMAPAGEGGSGSYAGGVPLPTPGSTSDAIALREFSIIPTLRTTGYRQRTVHSVVFKIVEFEAEADRELVVCEVNDEGCETYKTVHYHFYGILGHVDGLENAWTEAQQVANYWRSHFSVPIRAIDPSEQHAEERVSTTTAPSPSVVDAAGHIAIVAADLPRRDDLPKLRHLDTSLVVAGSVWCISAGSQCDCQRVTEQVRGRLVHHYTEIFKKGSSKTVAVLVDGESLRSVLVLEAWSAADQAHMKQALLPHAGQVVCLTAFKAQSRGRSLVFFDRDLRVAFDKSTKVTLGTGEYPMKLPLLPQVKDAMLCANSCMISIEVVLLEDPVTKDVTLQDGGKKQSGDSSLNAAFWHPLSEQMQSASKNGVYRLDWVMLIPEGAGRFKLTTGAGSEVSQSFGEAATVARSNLSENITSLSAV